MKCSNLFLGCALAGALSVVGMTAFAQEPVDQTTYFTFSAPVELPGGKTLPAGKYTFRVADSPSNRHIVQIMSADRSEVLATILAIPAQRQDPPSEPEVRFLEAAAAMPPAIRTWWYPGRTIGHEFIYPKEQARRLAARQTESVLSVSGDQATAEAMQNAELARISPDGRETAWRTDEQAAAQRTAMTTPSAEQAPAPPTNAQMPRAEQPVAEPLPDDEPRTTLPQTASPLPLVGLLGLVSLAGAAILRMRG